MLMVESSTVSLAIDSDRASFAPTSFDALIDSRSGRRTTGHRLRVERHASTLRGHWLYQRPSDVNHLVDRCLATLQPLGS